MIYFYISLATYLCFAILKYANALDILKQKKYQTKEYFKAIKENKKEIFLTPEILVIILIILAEFSNLKIIEISTVIFYMLLTLYILKKKNKKITLNKHQIIRLIFILLIYILLNIYFVIDYHEYHSSAIIFDNTPFYYIILYIVNYLSYIIVGISNIPSRIIDKFLKEESHVKNKRKRNKSR